MVHGMSKVLAEDRDPKVISMVAILDVIRKAE